MRDDSLLMARDRDDAYEAELEVLQAHARDLPESCRVVSELHASARLILDKLAAGEVAELEPVATTPADLEAAGLEGWRLEVLGTVFLDALSED